jgi:hypothetical protein
VLDAEDVLLHGLLSQRAVAGTALRQDQHRHPADDRGDPRHGGPEAAGQLLLDRADVAADPYLTLVGYFNATREL